MDNEILIGSKIEFWVPYPNKPPLQIGKIITIGKKNMVVVSEEHARRSAIADQGRPHRRDRRRRCQAGAWRRSSDRAASRCRRWSCADWQRAPRLPPRVPGSALQSPPSA